MTILFVVIVIVVFPVDKSPFNESCEDQATKGGLRVDVDSI